MTRRLISTGSSFEEEVGYSRAVVQGDWCFVAGTTGYDYGRMHMPEGVAEQAENTIATIAKVLEEAGFSLEDVVRLTHIIPNRADVPAVLPVLRRHFGAIRPASTMVIADLMTPEMKIEIEATALRRSA